jgi:hypothetical protein
MARYLPGLPAFYSMKGEIFTYERTYTTGKVGPFLMGEPREKALMAIESGHSDDLLLRPSSGLLHLFVKLIATI